MWVERERPAMMRRITAFWNRAAMTRAGHLRWMELAGALRLT
ncbi:hypothetical protein ACS15_1652 [Ralstonia insidiosa]|uniref:Uncharacterized protein n=1 Tax=Ralstonia insidiosa TaxID=190721 RepID=A0AAC9FSZ7_9RALS|nr:hypothetical protein ACS15_1652 [Ralstonia insidiosa]EPX98069.1 hypothetical protein C404_10565 [Ralstonia sp. AU12-08]